MAASPVCQYDTKSLCHNETQAAKGHVVNQFADHRLLRLLLSTAATCLSLPGSTKLQCMVPWPGTCRGSCLSAIQGQTSCGPTPGAGWSPRLTGIWLTAPARVTWSVGCELGRMLWQAHSRKKCTGLCLMMSVTSGLRAGIRLCIWFLCPDKIGF